MDRFLPHPLDLKTLSPLTLAYIGDGVFELLIREQMINEGHEKPDHLHKKAITMTCAAAQKNMAEVILPLLSEKELAVFKRGRNAKAGHACKSASVGEYHMATALEALFGYLYLDGQQSRLLELFSLCLEGDVNEHNC